MRRKLLAMTAALLCGIVYMYYFQSSWLIPTLIAVLGFSLAALGKGGLTRKFLIILLSCFLAGCFLLSLEKERADHGPLARACGQEQEFHGKVVQVQKTGGDSWQICCAVGEEKVLLSYYHPLENYWQLHGSVIKFSASLERPKPAGNPRTFDYKVYLKSRQIYYVGIIDGFEAVSQPKGFLAKAENRIFTARENMLLAMKLSPAAEGFLRGVLFGDTKGLSEETYEEFRQNATAHVLAVSGLHVGMLYGIYRALYKKKKSLFLTVAFVVMLLIYGTATLWSVSVSRAIALILLALAADLLHRRYDMVTALAFAALCSVIKNPYVIFGASFQMSFLAAASLAVFTPVLARHMKERWAVCLSVQLGLLPYMAYTFNFVSFMGIFANIPVVFLVSILVPAGMGSYLLYLGFGVVFAGLPSVCEGLSNMIVWANHLFASGGFLSFDVVSPPLWFMAVLYCGGFMLASEYFTVYFGRRDWSRLRLPLITVILAAALGASAGVSAFDRAQVVFVDVGQGDCLHLKGDKGRNILMDGGGNIRYNIGEKTLKPYLLKNGVSRLSLAAATHLHTDHYLGLEQLMEVFPVDHTLTEGQAGQRIEIGKDQWIDILWPVDIKPDTDDENLNSLIFKVYMNGLTILVTGDITEEGERMLIERYRGTDALSADILKVAHHGSAYSTCDAFLEAVSPKAAVISVGKNNYGHPSHKVIEKLQKKGIMVYRTDLDGAVGIINRKGRISVCTKNP